MDSVANSHVSHLTQNKAIDNPIREVSIPKPSAQTRRSTITKPTIDVHFAELAREKPSSSSSPSPTCSSDHAREVYINRQLVDQFSHTFDMSASDAKAAVEEEMKRRYAPNPWDAPCPRRLKPQRFLKVGNGMGELGPDSRDTSRHSEEEWDLFERVLGYK